MKLLKEHHEEFRHTGALDNVLERGGRGIQRDDWVHMAEQPPNTENYALLYWVRGSIHALEVKGAALNKMKKGIHINTQRSATQCRQPL